MKLRILQFVLPSVWLGLLLGISLIEAPLKFQAPGITIPLGLGIGRLVFGAMNIAEAVIAVALVVSLIVGGRTRWQQWLAVGIVATLGAKALVIRPIMQATTDAVIAGTSEGGSSLHLLYIAADGMLIVLLLAFLVATSRRLKLVTVELAAKEPPTPFHP